MMACNSRNLERASSFERKRFAPLADGCRVPTVDETPPALTATREVSYKELTRSQLPILYR